ncbi:TPA: hypothetical protein ACGBG5_003289 [Enterococcus faecalis]
MEEYCTADGRKTPAYLLAELDVQPIISDIYLKYEGKFELELIRRLIDTAAYKELQNRENIQRIREKLLKMEEDGE